MTKARRDRGVTTVEWVIVAMVIGVGCIAVWRTFKDQYMQPTAERMGDCIEAAAGDGNLCGGLATSGASNGGGAANGGAANGGGGAAGGALAQNGNGAANGGNGGNGGMTAGELANSVGNGGAAGGGEGGENGHAENPHAGLINGISAGMGLTAAGEDALIEGVMKRSGTELEGALKWLFKGARTAEGAIVGIPLDFLANGMPHSIADGASFTIKNGVIGLVAFFGTPLAGAALVGLDKSLGYLSDSITGGTRYQDDWKDSWAYQIAHLPPGTIGKDGVIQRQQFEQQMIHEELQHQRQQQQHDEEALREMMNR